MCFVDVKGIFKKQNARGRSTKQKYDYLISDWFY
jgi:hypothetical protein